MRKYKVEFAFEKFGVKYYVIKNKKTKKLAADSRDGFACCFIDKKAAIEFKNHLERR